ncbi:MAG: insulinase family protein [Deltaproteobacteria bacterium]|nr:insulinase family protein [Deltaproteobacteria bacterium]MCL5793133.1 insulinase family protein [Deltaproteobacteria bacterium]
MRFHTKSYTMKLDNVSFRNNKEQKIETFILQNGLKVFYEHVPDVPLVSIQAWVSMGSADETPKLAGISHVIEHMFFKGTIDKRIKEIAKEIESLGGYINAFTSFEETVFYITIRSEYLSNAMNILAQTLLTPAFDDNELIKEKEVILDEIKRGQDDLYQLLFLNLYEASYKSHPYSRPVIGYEHTVKSFTRDTILNYYKKGYIPSNINLVIVGDVPFNQVERLAYNEFSWVKSAGEINRIRPIILRQTNQRILIKNMDTKDTYYAIGAVSKPISHQHAYTLDVLAYILGGNDTSMLPGIVKDESKLVDSINVSSFSNKYTGFFTISGTTEPDKLGAAINKIVNTITEVAKRIPTDEEIKRAKQMLKSMFIYDMETVKQRGMKIGEAIVEMGGLDYIVDYPTKIDKVDAASIAEVVDLYFKPEHLNVVTIVPQKTDLLKSNLRILNKHSVKSGEPHYEIKRSEDTVIAALDSGLRIIVKEKYTIPAVAVSGVFLADSLSEPKDQIGLINVMSMMLRKGTHYRSESDIERESDNISGMFTTLRTKQSFGIIGEFLNTYIPDGLSIFSDMLLNPVFKEEELAKTKKDIISGLKIDKDNIALQARNEFIKLIYKGTRLSIQEKGDEHTLKSIDRKSLITSHENLVAGKNGVIAIAGAVDKFKILKQISSYLSEIKTGKMHIPDTHTVDAVLHKSKTVRYDMEKKQAHIITGVLTMPVNHEDRFPLILLDQILGSQSGRLFLELRDKRGLCYAVNTTGETKYKNKGWFGIHTATSAEKVEASLEVIKEELAKLYDYGVNDDEIEYSKRYVLSDYDNRKQVALTVASMLAYDELFEQGIDYFTEFPSHIKAVTRQDMNNIIKKYFSPDSFTTLVLIPAKK